MTGTTTCKRNTITDERALARFFDPQVIFQVRTKLHIHRSWRIPAKISKTEPMEQTQVTELSITSWNPDTLNHGKLGRFLTYFNADIIIFQGTRLRMRTILRPRTTQSLRSVQNGAQEGIRFSPGDGTMESSATTRAVCLLPFVRRRLGLDRLCRGTTRRDVASFMRDPHGQRSTRQRGMQGSAALESVDVVCETGAIDPLLGRTHLARTQWAAKAGLITFCSR